MKLSGFYIVILLLIGLNCFGQEDREVLRNGSTEESPVLQEESDKRKEQRIQMMAAPTEADKIEKQSGGNSDKKKEKKRKAKKKSEAGLTAFHKKTKRTVKFYVGETLKYKTKKGDEKIKGVLEELKGSKVIIDGKEVKLADLEMVGKKFGKTMGWRSVGLSEFALGTGVTAAGVALIVFSGQQYSVDNSNVVWSTLGIIAGSGTSFVGLHLMKKGGRNVFQSSNKKRKRGWTFNIK
ncbi:MAG: hypothetical protein ACPGEG_01160 [Salibacteraceae bacterium]